MFGLATLLLSEPLDDADHVASLAGRASKNEKEDIVAHAEQCLLASPTELRQGGSYMVT